MKSLIPGYAGENRVVGTEVGGGVSKTGDIMILYIKK